MGIKKSMERFLGITPTMKGRERGQILVLVAMAMVGLLAAAGLAVDAGFLMMRKSQFDRAVDAAALAGAPAASVTNLEPANVRGMQLLAANGIVITHPTIPISKCSNGVLPESGSLVPIPSPPGASAPAPINYYCGQYSVGTFPGSVRYRTIVRWNVPLFFMPIIGINHVPLTSDATAEYYSMVDLFVSESGNTSMIRKFNLELFGPRNDPDPGDPFTPIYWKFDKGINQYLPVGNPDLNPWWGELEGAYTYRIVIPSDYGYNKVRVELFDPDSWNRSGGTADVYNFKTGARSSKTCGARQDPCLFSTPNTENPWWFMRVDENRRPGGGGESSYDDDRNTSTLYRLYYYRQRPDGSLEPVDLAYYIGKPSGTEAELTDLTWVSPVTMGDVDPNELMPEYVDVFEGEGANVLYAGPEPNNVYTENCDSVRLNGVPTEYIWDAVTWKGSNAVACTGNGDFVVDLSSEVPGIYKAPGVDSPLNLYLEVRGLDGSSENGYSIWAGPSRTEVPEASVPANINARQVYMQRQLMDPPTGSDTTYHSSRGIGVYGMGHLPMNSNDAGLSIFPVAYLGAEYAGQDMVLEFYDLDVGTCSNNPCLPVIIYFEHMPREDWAVCVGRNAGTCSGQKYTVLLDQTKWAYADWGISKKWISLKFTVPSDAIGVPFYGDRLIIQYDNGKTDTFGLKLTVEGRPVLFE